MKIASKHGTAGAAGKLAVLISRVGNGAFDRFALLPGIALISCGVCGIGDCVAA